jgi:hypothetical protein
MTSKLTLSVDPGVVERAKLWAAKRHTSLSRVVEEYLDLVTRPLEPGKDEGTPVLRELRGWLKGARLEREDHRRHLERKYR